MFKKYIRNLLFTNEEIASIANDEIKKVIIESDKQQSNNRPQTFPIPLSFNQKSTQNKKYTGISFTTLRQFSIYYPIARACINRIKKQVNQLEWDIIPKEEHIETSEKETAEIKDFFKHKFGKSLSSYLNKTIEDLLVLDASATYKRQSFGGEVLKYIPIDAQTIVLRVNDIGDTPEPPEIAFAQYIRGMKNAEFATDEMIYEMMNPRTDTPYGLSPLESLIMQVNSALSSASYNLSYLTEGNTPEGFMTLPEGWNKDMITEWQSYWDALLAGDPAMQRRMKFVPHGSVFTPSRKPEDMAFQKFEMWLMNQTCAMFGVPPQDIGITVNVNRATAEVEQIIGKESGLRPVINHKKELFDDIIQNDLGHPNHAFMWINVEPQDLLIEAQVADLEIKNGTRSVDENRRETGRKEIGLGHYVVEGGQITMVSDLIDKELRAKKRENQLNPPPNPFSNNQPDKDDDDDVDKVIKLWKRNCVDRFNKQKSFKKFKTNVIPKYIQENIEEKLEYATTKEDINKVFNPYIGNNLNEVISGAIKLHEEINEFISK